MALAVGPPSSLRAVIASALIGAGMFVVMPGIGMPAEIVPLEKIKSTWVTNRRDPDPIRVRGVVTWKHESGAGMFVQDLSTGIYAMYAADHAADRMADEIDVGTEVEIEGGVIALGFAPTLLIQKLRAIGHRSLPEPIPQDAELFFRGGYDARLISVNGIVRGVYEEPRQWRIIAETNLRTFEVEVRKAAMPSEFANTLRGLVDASVRFVGAAACAYNARGEFLWPRVFVAKPEWITVVEAPRHEPFSSPHVPIDSLARYRSTHLNGHMIRTAGTVVHTVRGQSIFLQEHAHGTLVHTQSHVPVKPGDRVEAAGFVDRRGAVASLTDAVVRVLSSGSMPDVIEITPDEIIAVQAKAALLPAIATPGDYEGCLVRFPARLLEKKTSHEETILFLMAGKTSVNAILRGDHAIFAEGLHVGSELAVTGIVQGLFEQVPMQWPIAAPSRFALLLRSPADVTLLRAVPWWTAQRLGFLLTGVVATLLVAVFWGLALRRHLRAQELRLAAEIRIRHEAAIEFDAAMKERNRLAANLHDTLLQTLGGIGYQLDACEGTRMLDEEESRQHFDVARRMVSHATSELHSSVWALRSLPLRGNTFAGALRSMCERVGEGHVARINVETSGPVDDVPDFVAGNLLLIVQEAVYNALRHGGPSAIDVRVSSDPITHQLQAIVRDNGSGFAVADSYGVEQGHFGLHGMRERAERLGGTLRIETGADQGTTIRATVQLKDYDRNLMAKRALATG